VALAGPFMSRSGEQMLVYQPDGTLTVWATVDRHGNARE
jgi:hypothetical protein